MAPRGYYVLTGNRVESGSMSGEPLTDEAINRLPANTPIILHAHLNKEDMVGPKAEAAWRAVASHRVTSRRSGSIEGKFDLAPAAHDGRVGMNFLIKLDERVKSADDKRGRHKGVKSKTSASKAPITYLKKEVRKPAFRRIRRGTTDF
jgi:hypothetical protein